MTVTVSTFTLKGTTYNLKRDLIFDITYKSGIYELIDKYLGIYIIASTKYKVKKEYENTFAIMYDTYSNLMDFECDETMLKVKEKLLELVEDISYEDE